jgi:hypothetical protein
MSSPSLDLRTATFDILDGQEKTLLEIIDTVSECERAHKRLHRAQDMDRLQIESHVRSFEDFRSDVEEKLRQFEQRHGVAKGKMNESTIPSMTFFMDHL